jgi:hypothetical protein
VANPGTPIDASKALELTPPAARKAMLAQSTEQNLEKHRERFLKEHGVCCFSELNDDLLMWSHYGGRYQGICLEFRTSYKPFNKLRKVTYTDKMPQIKIADLVINSNYVPLFESLFCTKSQAWCYEHEWRGFHAKAATPFVYEAEALKAVYFGPNTDQFMREIVCLILNGQNPNVELWRGRRSLTEFKVEFDRFTYAPYVVGKKLGLIP